VGGVITAGRYRLNGLPRAARKDAGSIRVDTDVSPHVIQGMRMMVRKSERARYASIWVVSQEISSCPMVGQAAVFLFS